jgi:signal transduction histidine kinase
VRWRLIAILVGFTALVLLIQNVPLATYLRTVERDTIVAGLQRDAFLLAGLSVEALESGDPAAIAALQAPVEDYSERTGAVVVVTDAAGVAVAATDPADVGEDYSNRPEIVAALEGNAVAGERASQTLGEPLLYVAVPARAGPQVVGAVRITYPLSAVDDAVAERSRGLLVAGLITLLSAAVIAVLVASAVTRRVRRLRDAAEQIAEGDLTARAEDTGRDELGDLATSFNVMADRVQAVVESQRGFAGDASHQLRTPLTALRLRLDRAAELLDEDEPAVEQVDAARDEIDRLQRLVDGLLVLARAEGRRQDAVPTDVVAVVRERVESWEALAAERDVRVELEAVGTAVALAVPTAVEQVVDNYVDNAIESAPAGARVLVSVASEGDDVVLRVDDSGPGLSAEDRARAFDRFWRGRQDQSGSGLGLAVVASLAAASGAEVRLEESPLGGVRAVARFRRP